MTFASKIHDIIDVFKIINDEDSAIHTLIDLENIIQLLIDNYNENETESQYKFIKKNNPVIFKSICNCIFMILYKIQAYYKYLKQPNLNNKNIKYLKSFLFYNARHSNYDIYIKLKEYITAYFKYINISNSKIIHIITKLIVNKQILEELFISDISITRKNAFNINNKLEINNKKYGDPHFSLISYFDFFENPINPLFTHDWLEQSKIDIYSAQINIVNDIFLVEVRSFKQVLSNFINKIPQTTNTKKLYDFLINSGCNRITKKNNSYNTFFSLSTLKEFVHIYDTKVNNGTKLSSKTQKIKEINNDIKLLSKTQ